MKKNIEKVCGFRKKCYLCNRNRERCFLEIRNVAEIAQLVEHNLAKVGVAGPSPVFRSHILNNTRGALLRPKCPGGGIGRRARFRCVCFTTCRFESCSGHIIIQNVFEKLERWRNW